MKGNRRYNAGTVHYLDFDAFEPVGAEMPKGRAVVIVSPMNRRTEDLVIAVPISSRPPTSHRRHTVRIMHPELNAGRSGSWAKCDMPVTVSISRLEAYRTAKFDGQNHIPSMEIRGDELRRIREAMMRAIGAKELLERLRLEFKSRHNGTIGTNAAANKPVATQKQPVLKNGLNYTVSRRRRYASA